MAQSMYFMQRYRCPASEEFLIKALAPKELNEDTIPKKIHTLKKLVEHSEEWEKEKNTKYLFAGIVASVRALNYLSNYK